MMWRSYIHKITYKYYLTKLFLAHLDENNKLKYYTLYSVLFENKSRSLA